jgi:tRNA(Arg) A34 adenosine deaminase TadA
MDSKEQNIQEQIAWMLKKLRPQSTSVAWIHKDDTLYFSCDEKAPPKPWNAVVNLIQGIFDTHLDHSFFILRERIYTTENPGHMAQGMVKLTAKRIQFQITPRDHQLLLPFKIIEVAGDRNSQWKSQWQQEPSLPLPQRFSSKEDAAGWCQRLANSVPRGEVLHDVNRAIGAILIDREGSVLASATNSNKLNKTLHAEVVAIQNYYREYRQPIPSGASLIVSLKPCVMCAGMLVEACEDSKRLNVFYLQEDPGAKARQDFLKMNQLLVAAAVVPD